ncbi:CRAL-TRIO domain-containing protein [Caerostris extrusa]|uniref:CRAL-TRIO domain-containing protein n=1 Tax=Caerostris extrusa TaxID=172846 RepID=A0AAV4RAK9_CAEEX|nr:CRAL-TRIO domain-containing protein [Caerostris extrusa]
MTSFSDAPIHKQDELLPLELNYMPECVLKKKEVEFNGIQADKQKCLQELKYLLDGQKMSTGIDFEDDFLHLYLMHSKYRVNRAFSFIRNYLNLRKNHSYFFRKVDFDFTIIPACQFATVLPYRCQDGSVTVLCELVHQPIARKFVTQVGRSSKQASWIQTRPVWNLLKNPFLDIPARTAQPRHASSRIQHHPRLRRNGISAPQALHPFACVLTESHNSRYISSKVFGFSFGEWQLLNEFVDKPVKASDARGIQKNRKSSSTRLLRFADLLNHFPRSVLPVKYGGKQTDYYAAEWLRKANGQQDNFPAGGQKNIF